MAHNSFIELNRSSLEQNVDFIRNLIGDHCVFSSVVKGNAYGHGITYFIPMAESLGVTHFSVFDSHEAREVFEAAVNKPTIMIMGWIHPDDFEWVIKHDIEFYIFEMNRLRCAVELAKKTGKKARIHIELETGMNRTGFQKKSVDQAINYIMENKELFEIKGICTHFAGAESIANYHRISHQIRLFNAMVKQIKQNGIVPESIHVACSAAAINFPKTHYDMVRIGILQYGFWPSRETLVYYMGKNIHQKDPLNRIISWKTQVMDTKWINPGEFVGYGTSFMAENKTKIAAIPVGYAHGYSRALSNVGQVLVNDQRVSVVGIVNMNMMLVDVTSVPETKMGDEVVLIGTQGNKTVSVASFSEMSNQLNYEMLTRIPMDIPRITID